MAAPETQSTNDGNASVLVDEAVPVARSAMAGHDWVTYLMVIAMACVVVGAPLALLGDAKNNSTMLLVGAICFTVSAVVWVGPLVFFAWKTIETGRIAVPLLWRRIRR